MNMGKFCVPPAKTLLVVVNMLCIPNLPIINYNYIIEIPFVKISTSCSLVVIKGVKILFTQFFLS